MCTKHAVMLGTHRGLEVHWGSKDCWHMPHISVKWVFDHNTGGSSYIIVRHRTAIGALDRVKHQLAASPTARELLESYGNNSNTNKWQWVTAGACGSTHLYLVLRPVNANTHALFNVSGSDLVPEADNKFCNLLDIYHVLGILCVRVDDLCAPCNLHAIVHALKSAVIANTTTSVVSVSLL